MNYIGMPGIKASYRKECAPKITPDKVIQVVCNHYNIDRSDLKGRCRQKELVHARHVIFYLLRNHASMTLKSAGALFNRDHTTVIHGVQKLHDLMDTEPAVKAEVEVLEGFVKG